MSYELLMLLRRKINFSQQPRSISLGDDFLLKISEEKNYVISTTENGWRKKVKNTSRICMLKTRFKPMGRGVLPYLARVNNFIYKHHEQDIFLGWKP